MTSTHLEVVMGTVVGLTSTRSLSARDIRTAAAQLHEADRVFSTYAPSSPLSALRSGALDLDDLELGDAALIREVMERSKLARDLSDGAFDPWAMPGGFDPTGLVKGWAAARALGALEAGGCADAMVNAGGDIAVHGGPDGRPWRVGLRHPSQRDALVAVIEVTSAVATSGNYERPGQLLEPRTGRAASVTLTATVIGPDLDLADALATGLAVAGRPLLRRIDALPGYEAHLITAEGRHFATPGMPFVPEDRAARVDRHHHRSPARSSVAVS